MSDAPPPADLCPRCGGAFHCGMQDTRPCPCTTVTLSEALLAELRRRYTGCLCLGCLAELAQAEAPVSAPRPAPPTTAAPPG